MARIYKTPKQKNKETKLILITYGGGGGPGGLNELGRWN